MALKLQWRGPQVLEELTAKAAEAVDEIDLRIESFAKQELYPGHGKVTGTLQRSITTKPARRQGMKVVGAVGSNLKYARRIHFMYFYITEGLAKVQPLVPGIVQRKMGGR